MRYVSACSPSSVPEKMYMPGVVFSTKTVCPRAGITLTSLTSPSRKQPSPLALLIRVAGSFV